MLYIIYLNFKQNLLILVPLDTQLKHGPNDIFIVKFDLTVHILYGVTIILREYPYFSFLFTLTVRIY